MKTFNIAGRKEFFLASENEMRPTFKHSIVVWWSCLWRIAMMFALTMMLGGYICTLLGILLVAFGVSFAVIKLIAIPAIAIVGLVLFFASILLFPLK